MSTLYIVQTTDFVSRTKRSTISYFSHVRNFKSLVNQASSEDYFKERAPVKNPAWKAVETLGRLFEFSLLSLSFSFGREYFVRNNARYLGCLLLLPSFPSFQSGPCEIKARRCIMKFKFRRIPSSFSLRIVGGSRRERERVREEGNSILFMLSGR